MADDAEQIAAAAREALAGFNVLFQETRDGRRVLRELAHGRVLELCHAFLRAASRGPAGADDAPDDSPDAVDYYNGLLRSSGERGVVDVLTECVWDALGELLPAGSAEAGPSAGARLAHAAGHAARLVAGVGTVLGGFPGLCGADGGAGDLPRMLPAGKAPACDAAGALAGLGRAVEADIDEAAALIKAHDRFSISRAFRVHRGRIVPTSLGPVRTADELYGYDAEKRFFERYFARLHEGKRQIPLLLTGLPGLGKTQFTLSYSLRFADLVLVLADPPLLAEPLDGLLATFGRYAYRRFVLFFDDVEPGGIDWSAFRSHADGYLLQPANTAIVAASNYPFPASVVSRSTALAFREMDVELCGEMVADYIGRRGRGSSGLAKNLVSLMVLDYVNEYINGPLNELTPRSLVRYLEMLEGDVERRKVLCAEALSPSVRKPSDGTRSAFHESNERIRGLMDSGPLA